MTLDTRSRLIYIPVLVSVVFAVAVLIAPAVQYVLDVLGL